jgi:tetratricopeptide (TPR) repeat protein
MGADWYRNTTWDESIEKAFDEKLGRARKTHRAQYLRIQATTLAELHPDVALKLLDRYFELTDGFDVAQARVDQATALVSLERIDEAIVAYESALAWEAAHPNYRTSAYLSLPFLIATHGVRSQYARAIEILASGESRLMFPVERFEWHAANALIAAAIGEVDAATRNAERALEAAACAHSGFRYHPTVGLVTQRYENVIKQLEGFLAR